MMMMMHSFNKNDKKSKSKLSSSSSSSSTTSFFLNFSFCFILFFSFNFFHFIQAAPKTLTSTTNINNNNNGKNSSIPNTGGGGGSSGGGGGGGGKKGGKGKEGGKGDDIPGGGSTSGSAPDYSLFQISDGKAGNALERAESAYQKFTGNSQMFENVKSITDQQDKIISDMRIAAQTAEAKFVSALSAAGGQQTAEGAPIFHGMISNKVLKLVGILLVVESEIAKTGTSHASSDTPEQIKKLLTNNINMDKAASGKPQKGVVGAGAGAGAGDGGGGGQST